MGAEKIKPEYKTEIFTGIRPTGSLTVANFLGAVNPILDLQKKGHSILVFVADLHALTDNEPSVVKKYCLEVAADYIALGIDPSKTKIFLQSEIENEVMILSALLSRHTTVAELLRVPALKDKLKNNARPETANALLFLYPVIMAADILLQRSKFVPVGEDQLAHIEMTRELARRFNKKYASIFPEPKALQMESLRILSLKGENKMSKSEPSGAIFLMDDPDLAAKKIKTAETAFEGIMNPRLESHILVAKGICRTEDEQKEIDAVIKEHKEGKAVMGKFKQLFTNAAVNFLKDFQVKRKEITKDQKYLSQVLEQGKITAQTNARETLALAKQALF